MAIDWPELDWTPPAKGADAWARERVESVAVAVRTFEVALENAAEAGEVDLATVEDELSRWDKVAAVPFAYTAMGKSKPIPSEAARFARELERAWTELAALRGRMLERLGEEGAVCVLEREERSTVDRSLFRPRAAPPPQSLSRFTGEFPAVPEPPLARPVKAEEVRMRQVAEQKPLPESRKLGALLGMLPSEWVTAVFENLEIPVDEDEEMTAGSRGAARRKAIHDRLHDSAFLRRVVETLSLEEKELLGEVLGTGGGMAAYRRLAERYGHDEADGFYWSERPPSGPLARLRRSGLLYVGTHKGVTVVAAPSDLEDALKETLKGGGG
jgi:hypothetical protein